MNDENCFISRASHVGVLMVVLPSLTSFMVSSCVSSLHCTPEPSPISLVLLPSHPDFSVPCFHASFFYFFFFSFLFLTFSSFLKPSISLYLVSPPPVFMLPLSVPLLLCFSFFLLSFSLFPSYLNLYPISLFVLLSHLRLYLPYFYASFLNSYSCLSLVRILLSHYFFLFLFP